MEDHLGFVIGRSLSKGVMPVSMPAGSSARLEAMPLRRFRPSSSYQSRPPRRRPLLSTAAGAGASQLGPGISLKLETMQPTGSFKVRGWLAAVAATLAEDPSSAPSWPRRRETTDWALPTRASKLDASVTVIVPLFLASAAKVSAIQQFDVRLVLHGEGYSEAEAHALDLVAQDGGRYVSPYNDPDVIAGQSHPWPASCWSRCPNIGTVIVPVGGGGLLAGITLGLADSGVRVVGVESEASPSMSATLFLRGASCPSRLIPPWPTGWPAISEAGAVTVDVALANKVEILTVSEADIRSATAFAAYSWAWFSKAPVRLALPRCGPGWCADDDGGNVVLLTGRNVAPTLLSEVLHS